MYYLDMKAPICVSVGLFLLTGIPTTDIHMCTHSGGCSEASNTPGMLRPVYIYKVDIRMS